MRPKVSRALHRAWVTSTSARGPESRARNARRNQPVGVASIRVGWIRMRDDDPKEAGAQPPFKPQQQEPPGETRALEPRPDHGEQTYKGSGKLEGRAALITGADSGIGRAVAIAFAREGADVLISYLEEHEDARETARWVEQAGRKAMLMAGDVADPKHCRALVERTVREFGRLDVRVNNAAYQMTFKSLDAISDEEWDKTFQPN